MEKKLPLKTVRLMLKKEKKKIDIFPYFRHLKNISFGRNRSLLGGGGVIFLEPYSLFFKVMTAIKYFLTTFLWMSDESYEPYEQCHMNMSDYEEFHQYFFLLLLGLTTGNLYA